MRFEIHFMANSLEGANVSSKDVSGPVEEALKKIGLEPTLSHIVSNNGHDDATVFIEGERVPLAELVEAYKEREAATDVVLKFETGYEDVSYIQPRFIEAENLSGQSVDLGQWKSIGTGVHGLFARVVLPKALVGEINGGSVPLDESSEPKEEAS